MSDGGGHAQAGRGSASHGTSPSASSAASVGKRTLVEQMGSPGSAGRTAAPSQGGQRSAQPIDGKAAAPTGVPGRGDYLVELTSEGNYVFVFNSFDVRAWSEPSFIALRYYMQQVFPGIGDDVIRHVLKDLHVSLGKGDPVPEADDAAYEVRIQEGFHQLVIGWMKAHHPARVPQTPRVGGGGLHHADVGARGAGTNGGGGERQAGAAKKQGQGELGGQRDADGRGMPQRGSGASDSRVGTGHGRGLPVRDDGDSAGDPHAHAGGKRSGAEAGRKDGDAREHRDGGVKNGSIHGEPGGDEHGWMRWEPRGQLQVLPKQPAYVAGSSVHVELAWDLAVHPDAGLILLPSHCSYRWTVRREGKAVDSAGHSLFADDRRASLALGKEPGTYQIEVVATSNHFKTEHHRFTATAVVNAVSEKAFDRATFDAAQIDAPDAAFARDDKGKLHLKAGETAPTTQAEIAGLDLTRGSIEALGDQGKINDDDRQILIGQIGRQRAALEQIQNKVKDGTPYIVRGTFVSREDSSATSLRLLMHMVRRGEASAVAHYDLLLHDTTFGEVTQHPGRAQQRFARDPSAALYRQLEGAALDDMAQHFHAHNDYPRGTVHLAAQSLTTDAVWERTVDTDNRRKTAKKILGTAAAVGGIAMLIVPGGTTVSAGLMVVSSAAGVASVALEVEDRMAKEGQLKLDRRVAMDVLQVVALSLPFGALTRAFSAATQVGKGRFLLCMTGLDVAQGFLIASDAHEHLRIIDADTSVRLAGATSDEQRTQIHAERDRRVAEVIGGAMVTGGFLLVSLGHGIKNVVATTRTGARFRIREPVRELAGQGRERMQDALTSDTFEHDGARVPLTSEERRYLEHEVNALDSKDTAPRDTIASAARTARSSVPESHGTSSHGASERTVASEVAALLERDAAAAANDRYLALPERLVELREGLQARSVNPTKIAYDTPTNSAHFELSVGEKTLRIEARLAPRIGSFAEIDAGANRIVGQPMSSVDGHRALAALVNRDPSMLAAAGLGDAGRMPRDPAVEFGLGRILDGRVVVIRGEVRAVDWSALPGIEPIGHTHPSIKGNDLPESHSGRREVPLAELLQPTRVPLLARELVFPSAEDFLVMAHRAIDGHRVYTPFVVRDGMVMKPPSGDAASHLQFTIGRPVKAGTMPGGEVVYRSKVDIQIENERRAPPITREVWVIEPSDGASGHLYMTEPAGMTPAAEPAGGRTATTRAKAWTSPLEKLARSHGDRAVEWAHGTLPDADVERLLGEMLPSSLPAIEDISAIDAIALIDQVTAKRVNTALALGPSGPVRGKHLEALRRQVPPHMLVDLLDSAGTNAGRLTRLARIADGLAPADARLGASSIGTESVIIDSNARIAIDELVRGVGKRGQKIERLADLDLNYQNAIHAVRHARGLGAYVDPPSGTRATVESVVGPDADLRATSVVGAEAMAGAASTSGSPTLAAMKGVHSASSHPDHAGVLEDLRGASIGGNKGAVDRSLIADAMFADHAAGGTPKLVTSDESLCVSLARAFVSSPRRFSPTGAGGTSHWDQLLARFPEGHFTVEVRGHKVEVYFHQAVDATPHPP